MIEKIIEMFKEKRDNASLECAAWKRGNAYERADGRRCAFIEAIEIVQEVAKEYDWIPVTERLPEEHKRVLVELSNGWQVVATHDGEEWVLVWHYYIPIETDYVKVVQWRYLDVPYQKGE